MSWNHSVNCLRPPHNKRSKVSDPFPVSDGRMQADLSEFLQVSTAASWQSARQADMRAHNAVTLDYDWCSASTLLTSHRASTSAFLGSGS